MRKALLILLSGIFCALIQPMSAQMTAPESLVSDTLISIADTLASDSVPEWYVAPEIPLFLRAPKHTAATACSKVAAIQTYDINSQLVEATYYEYDNAGRVISTTVWTHNADGSQTGKSKQKYSFDAYGNQVSTVVYDWDNTMNIWHGVSRYEYVYDAEQRMLSNTEYAWVNYAWAADIKYTWAYDAEGREAEYFSYKRNTTTNQLDPVNGFIYTWLSDTQKSLEIIYTTYSNGAWNGGTKKEWAFDAEGRQTSYTYYSTITNGNWVGSSKETWTYGGPIGQLTLYEKFGWTNNNWSKTIKEETAYEGNNIVRIENYTYANGVTTGTRKEEYTYENNKPKQTIIYAWSNGMWIGSSNETWLYGGPSGQLTLHEKYEWLNNNWSITLKEETQYSGANIVRIENYTYANGVPTGTKKELTTYSGGKKTQILTFAWENGAWVNGNRETWEFNGPSGKQTKHEKCEWDGSDWAVMVQENTIYNGNTTTVINYERLAGVWTGTKKEENTVEGGKPTQTIIYAWENDDWVDFSKETWGYTSGKKTSYEKYLWENDAYVKSVKEVWAYSGNSQTLYEKYEGQNDAWVGLEKEVWGYTSGRQTLYETYEWYNNNWSITLREKSGYDAAGNMNSIENYAGSEGVLTGTQKEEYTFNSAKEIVVTIKYKWTENIWVKDTKNEAGYIEGDTEYSEVNYAWDGSTWIGTGYKTSTTYIGDKVSEEWGYTWDAAAGDWGYAAHRVVVYDTKNRLVGDTTYRYVNSEWEYYKIQTHGYDSRDNDTLAVTATWNGTEWVPTFIKKGTYTYTASGKPLLIEVYSGLEGNWTGNQKVVYVYDEYDRQISYWQYDWGVDDWVKKNHTEQAYDSEGHKILDLSQNWTDNKTWRGVYKYEYTYESDRVISSAQYTGTKNGWVGFSRNDKTYYPSGEIKSETTFAWVNNAWLSKQRTEYVYDEQGRVVDQKIFQYKNGSWNKNQWRTIEYDSYGNAVYTLEYRWSSNTWKLLHRQELTYDADGSTLRREINGSWTTSGTQNYYTDNYYFYGCEPHFYTIGFMNYDGKGLAYHTQKEGQMPEYKGDTPTKPSTVEYAYTFAGWTPEVVAVSGEATYTATYSETKNKYTITWLNEDGSTIIDQTNVAYGEVPTHTDASKDNTAQYTYTFTGWSPTITAVTGNASYTAQFNSTVNKYTITFKNGNEVLQSSEVAFGEKPVYGGSIPTKDPDDQYRYAFAGWDKEIVEVAGEETYTATFSTTTNEYTISWFNDDNSLIDQTTVLYGVVPTHDDPTKENTAEWTYIFSGWDHEPVAVTGAASYTATYTATKNSYTITWLNEDGDEIEHETLEYGKTPEHTAPVKENTAEWTYTFTGWTPAIESVKGDASYKATFSATKNSYTIQFLNYNGEVLQSTNVEYGVKPVYEGAIPAKPEDDEFHYAFAGWNKEIVEVAGEETYTATFTPTTNEYTITWFNDDNTLIDQTTVAYGIVPTHEDPTKENTAEFTYTFAGWDHDPVAVIGNASYKATYTATKNKYLVVFQDEGGAELQSGEVEYGTTPEFTGTEPSKEATAQYTYAFAGWDPEITAVEGAQTYTATYSSTVNKYTITWLNEDDSELQSSEVEYGTMPIYNGETPHKDADEQYTYPFAGWDSEPVAVTGEATYKATYSSTTNQYTVKFVNYDGEELQSSSWNYGAMPSYTGETPTKPADDENHYAFAGWSPIVSVVTKDATYTATYTEAVNEYTITWYNDDNTIIDQTTVAYGVVPTHDDPSKENTAEWTYTFSGWDHDPVAVIGNASYTATYTATKNSYTITWLNEDDSEIEHETLEYGATPSHEAPFKANTAEWTYTFEGWEPAIVDVTGNAEYTATFSATKNKYTITFLNYDGTELQSGEVEYGVKPTYEGADPTKPADAQDTYTFIGWDKDIVEVDGDATYTATYRSDVNSYTITWLNDDNSLLEETTVEYGKVPEHAAPTKENTAEWTYTFNGWDPTPVEVTGVATYKATFNASKNIYTITWKDEEGKEIGSDVLAYGETPKHEDLTKDNTAEWTYTFKGWTPSIIDVVGDATYTAVFDQEKNQYTIKFVNYDGSELQSTDVPYGEKPVYTGDTPTKPDDEEFHYAFAGWDKEIVKVEGEETYTATFTPTTNEYTITWFNDDNTIIDQTTVAYGVVPTHEDPTKENTAEFTYTFSGWDHEPVAVTGAASYTATYNATKNKYLVVFQDEGGAELQSGEVEYGTTPVYSGAEPSKEATAQYTYTFSGWDPEITAVESAQTYTAKYSSTVNSYTITWLNEDGSELSLETLEYGVTPQHEDLSKENTAEWTYTFTGWTPAIESVKGDASYKATFSATKNSYTITWLNDDGSELEHETLEYGATPSHADIYKESTAEWIYTFAGWDPEIKSVTGDASYTATFDAAEATIYYHITVTADDAVHGQAGFVYTDAESSTLLTDYNVASGTWIELRAIASDDWHFDHWSDGDIASVRQIEVTEDMQITAHFASNCGDYPTLPVVSLYDWLVMLDVRSIHAMGYTFREEDVIWYRVKGEPDKESDGAQADDVRVGSGYSFTLNESLINSGDYYAMVDISSSPTGTLCSGMMRSQIIHFASNRAYMPPRLTPALVRPCEPQQILHLDPEFPTTVMIYDLSGHLLRTFSEESVDRMDMQAENVTGCYQVVVQNGDQRNVLRYIVVQ